MRSHGHIDMNHNELQNAIIVMSDDSNFPLNPKIGQMLFKNRVVYICVDIGNNTPVWCPLTSTISAYNHSQPTAAQTWTITHNLQTTYPLVSVYDLNNNQILPNEVTVVDANTVAVSHSVAQAGRAAVVTGSLTGNAVSQVAFEYTQSSPQGVWTIAHNLGRIPIVRVFIGNQEVQPASVTFPDNNSVVVTFTSPQTGFARLI